MGVRSAWPANPSATTAHWAASVPASESTDGTRGAVRSFPIHLVQSINPAQHGMILSGHQIRANLGGNIVIDPFREAHLNPNSYNLTLHNELMTYEEVVLDMCKPNRVRRITIPPEGLVLGPSQLYLGRTVERTETHKLVPMIEGRSSIGRLGLFVHVTAGFGDVGFCGYWTLEMFAVQPVH